MSETLTNTISTITDPIVIRRAATAARRVTIPWGDHDPSKYHHAKNARSGTPGKGDLGPELETKLNSTVDEWIIKRAIL